MARSTRSASATSASSSAPSSRCRDQLPALRRVLDVALGVQVEVRGRRARSRSRSARAARRPSRARSPAGPTRSRTARRGGRAGRGPSPAHASAHATVSGSAVLRPVGAGGAGELVPQRDVRGLLAGVGGQLARASADAARRAVGRLRRARRRRSGTARRSARGRRGRARRHSSARRTDARARSSERARHPGETTGPRDPPQGFGSEPGRDATVAAGARPARHDPGAAVPARAALDQRGAAADGQADRPARPDRVLGLLPRQLAAHAAVPEGLARALRRARPARDRHPHRRLRDLARRGQRPARRRAARRPVPGRRSTRGSSCGTSTATRAGRPATCGTRAARCSRCTTARAPTRRPSARSRSCSASSEEPLPPLRPEDAPGVLLPAADRGPAGRLQRARTRPAASGRCSRARARSPSTAARSPSPSPAASRSSSTRTTPRACSSCGSARA